MRHDFRNNLGSVVLPVLVLMTFGCAATVAPDDWLPPPDQLQVDSYGGWLVVTSLSGKRTTVVEGEFIGLRDNFVCVLPVERKAMMISMDSILSARLQVHAKQHGRIAGWTSLGVISTLSHGFYLIITAPVWIVSGIISAASVSREGDYETDRPDLAWWKDMARFARFPQGIPESVTLDTLKRKPAPRD